ncbi:MAG TPA: hypothetical protein VLH85_00265, partial [Levilinea sp.]|nr:hypothetical protein [Levilinea sp.]
IFLAILMLLGLWILARRLGGRWSAAGVVWIMAASSANILIYIWAITQVIVACMLTWSLVLTLGKERPLWQTTLGAVLAVSIVLTRQNMLPVIPLLLLYILWQHGWKAAGYAALASSVVLVVVHAIFWPAIWSIWRPWLPEFMRGWISSGRMRGDTGQSVWNPEYSALTQLYVFWEGIRYNFFALWGALATWILWPRRRDWKSVAHFKIAVFLSVFLAILVAAHYWAAAFKDYCLFCYSGYLTFFAPAGILLVVVSITSWMRRPGVFRQILAAVLVVVSATGIAFGGYNTIYKPILNLPIPRITNMRILPGSTQLWRSLSNRFDLSFETLQQLLPTATGFAFGLFLLLLVAVIALWLRKKRPISFGYTVLIVFFILGVLLTPAPLFSADRLDSLCGWDVIASHEAVGEQLAQNVPPGSLVYWQNDVSPLPLLYIPGVQVFPAQLNHWYTFRRGGDPDLLIRFSHWNRALQQRWLLEADYALVADVYIQHLLSSGMINENHLKISTTPLTVPCREQSTIHIFRKSQ